VAFLLSWEVNENWLFLALSQNVKSAVCVAWYVRLVLTLLKGKAYQIIAGTVVNA